MDIYEIIKLILRIIFSISGLIAFIFLIRWIVILVTKNSDRKKRRRVAATVMISFLTSFLAIIAHFAITVMQYTPPVDIDKLPTFTVTSDNLHDGVWDERIGAKHGNVSPALSWEAVEYATKYAIVMIDYDGNNWLHWLSVTDEASVDEGRFKDVHDGYVGPYPPSGTHRYTVYVFALQSEPYEVTAYLDKGGANIQELTKQLNRSKINDYKNNIIAIGTITGEYSTDYK